MSSVAYQSPSFPISAERSKASAKFGPGPAGAKPKRWTPGRIGLYLFLGVTAAFFLVPLYVMLVTSFKTMPEVRLGNMLSPPGNWSIDPWVKAWSKACVGIVCNGISPGFWKSIQILIPSAILSILAGAISGYALSFWKPRGGSVLFGALMLGAFLPAQVFFFPLLTLYFQMGLQNTLAAVVLTHVLFGLPVQVLLFRNFYTSIPVELFKAARVDGAGFFQIFFFLVLPLSLPIIAVAAILKITAIWNDYIIGAVFGGVYNRPMTVLLKNLVAPEGSLLEYNVNMAATLLTAILPLLLYLLTGPLFVRGISAGAVKG